MKNFITLTITLFTTFFMIGCTSPSAGQEIAFQKEANITIIGKPLTVLLYPNAKWSESHYDNIIKKVSSILKEKSYFSRVGNVGYDVVFNLYDPLYKDKYIPNLKSISVFISKSKFINGNKFSSHYEVVFPFSVDLVDFSNVYYAHISPPTTIKTVIKVDNFKNLIPLTIDKCEVIADLATMFPDNSYSCVDVVNENKANMKLKQEEMNGKQLEALEMLGNNYPGMSSEHVSNSAPSSK
jgi:hypothetical protein